MSVYDDAILITYPSGVKVGKVYSQKPTDGTGDYTFSRSTTGTRVNASGVIVSAAIDEPRIDYTGGGCGALLREVQATNNVEYSQDFSNVWWNVKSNSSINSNSITSPDGTTNADKLVEDSSSSTHYMNKTGFTLSSGVDYTYSVFVKQGGRSRFWLRTISGVGATYFDVSNGTIPSGTGTIEDYGNGWYRCSVSGTASSTTANPYIYLVDSGTSNNYQGDGVSGVYLYGFQVEVGIIASSYIPTNGTAVTRTADICQVTTPTGVTSITETVGGVDTVITTIPSTYTMPIGRVETILME
jgi:hypothetical protein